MSGRDAGYPIGGSSGRIQGIARKLGSLGGRLRLGAKVERILVEDDTAVGVQLMDGETITADWVISAADGHATIYDLLEGKYTDQPRRRFITTSRRFLPTYRFRLESRWIYPRAGICNSTACDRPSRWTPVHNFDRSRSAFFTLTQPRPAGRRPLPVFLPTRNFEYWVHLREQDPAGYRAEKTSHRRGRHRRSREKRA